IDDPIFFLPLLLFCGKALHDCGALFRHPLKSWHFANSGGKEGRMRNFSSQKSVYILQGCT
ncbi:MAG: hypothetical protein Q3X94_09360, partial [Oscillospiraceae bacterium]|nr:hypothetical protein [Oscillospiraceae bacterium]